MLPDGDAAIEHVPLEAPHARSLLGVPAGTAVAADRPRAQVRPEQRADAEHLSGIAADLEGLAHQLASPRAERVDALDLVLGEQLEGCRACCGRHRVRRVGPAERERRPARRIEDLHVVGGAGHGADREAPADDLAEAGEVRRHAVEALRPAVAQPERDHLVEDEQAAVAARVLAQHRQKLRRRDGRARARGERVDQHAGKLTRVALEDCACALRLVVGKHDHRVGHAARRAGLGDGAGVALAPLLGFRLDRDVDEVGAAVVGALELRDLRAAGERACGAHRHEHRLGAGHAEADAVEGRHAIADQLCQALFMLVGEVRAGPPRRLLRDRLDDARVRVSVDEGGRVIVEVDHLVAVDIGQTRPVAACGEERVRPLAFRRRRARADAAGAAGDQAAGALRQLRRRGVAPVLTARGSFHAVRSTADRGCTQRPFEGARGCAAPPGSATLDP